MRKKVFYCASTAGHLVSFHIPYLKLMQSRGWTVHGGGSGSSDALDFLDDWIELPFEKSITSPENFKIASRLAKRLKKEQYDLIIVHTSLAAFFVRLALKIAGKGNTKLVNTVHGYLFDKNTPLTKRIMLLEAEKLMASVTDRIVTMNSCDTEIAKKHRLTKGETIEIPGMGIDTDKFCPPTEEQKKAARQGFGISPEAKVMVYAAEFSSRKNQMFLIKAMEKLPPDTVLLLPGKGGLREQCMEAAAASPGKIILPGFVKDMRSAYWAADICVSSSRSEGLPFNIMEAMACGLPVLATEVKGHTDLIQQSKNGWLYAYDSEKDFTALAMSILKSPEAIKEAGEKASASALSYGIKAVIEKTASAMMDI